MHRRNIGTSTRSRGSSGRALVGSANWQLRTTALALFLSVVAQSVQAAPINYGSFSGTSVVYSDVREDSNSGDTLPLFGEPSTVGPVTPGYPAVPCVLCGIPGNTLGFTPTGFGASASGAGGIDITDGNLSFKVAAKPGSAISNLLLSEKGDLTMAGTGTDLTNVGVAASGSLNISEVDGIGINTISVPFSVAMSPSGGTFGYLTDGGGGPFPYFDNWSGSLLLDVNGILTTAVGNGEIPAFTLGATKISINLDNTLVAMSQEGTSALIAKKDFGVNISVNIPEPTSCGLAVIGLLALLHGVARGRRFEV
jgi:hypothetical protein